MNERQPEDLWETSYCAHCGRTDCFGECPGYFAFEQEVIRKDICQKAERVGCDADQCLAPNCGFYDCPQGCCYDPTRHGYTIGFRRS